jgi:ferrous iron transport protein A
MNTLRDVRSGEVVTVIRLNGEGAIKRRIMDMGITRGAEVFVRKVAPLGDPVEVRVRGFELSIRKEDAEMIEVEAKAASASEAAPVAATAAAAPAASTTAPAAGVAAPAAPAAAKGGR